MLNQASEGADESGSQTVDPATRLKLWAKSAGGKNRGRLYGVGDRSSAYRPGVSSLAQTLFYLWVAAKFHPTILMRWQRSWPH
jgi:hypothetical protein